jgi:hypothetical protein
MRRKKTPPEALYRGGLIRTVARPRAIRHPFSGDAQRVPVAPANALWSLMLTCVGVHALRAQAGSGSCARSPPSRVVNKARRGP